MLGRPFAMPFRLALERQAKGKTSGDATLLRFILTTAISLFPPSHMYRSAHRRRVDILQVLAWLGFIQLAARVTVKCGAKFSNRDCNCRCFCNRPNFPERRRHRVCCWRRRSARKVLVRDDNRRRTTDQPYAAVIRCVALSSSSSGSVNPRPISSSRLTISTSMGWFLIAALEHQRGNFIGELGTPEVALHDQEVSNEVIHDAALLDGLKEERAPHFVDVGHATPDGRTWKRGQLLRPQSISSPAKSKRAC